ncbi:MAG TPA: glycosyltransferase [Vicinamibacterales bacterium]
MTAAVFAMSERGHFRRLLPVIAGLARAGVTTHVFTDLVFREEVTRAGGQFMDLFADHTVQDADTASTPIPCRFVTFAGRFGDAVVKAAAALQPSFVLHDTFAVVGRVVANHLGVPRINVCAGHNLAPIATLDALSRDPRVRVADACWAAVQHLRDRHGMPDASPFSYISAISATLNLYCEPPQFLRPEEREPFEPLAFFGSLWPEGMGPGGPTGVMFRQDPAATLRIYAAFGTVIWRYYTEEALTVLEALSNALADRHDAEAIIGLGGASSMDRVGRLASRNVRIEHYADQWPLLRHASLYLTHQGLNSTHEAIYHRVPMMSYPFFADQPALMARCQELGLAVPVVDTLRGPVAAHDVRVALDRIVASRAQMTERLAEGREWELETIRARPGVIARMIELIQ